LINDLNITQVDLFNGMPITEPNRRRPVRNERNSTSRVEQTSASYSDNEQPTDGPRSTSPGSKKPFKLRYVILLMIVVIGIITWSWHTNTMTQVTTIRVKNEYFTNRSAVIRQTGITLGALADSLNYRQIIQRVEQLPYVKQASLVEIPPHTLEIRIEERRPIGLLVSSDQTIYMDAEGVLLPTIPEKMPEVPLVYGITIPSKAIKLSGTSIQVMSRFLSALDQNELSKITLSDIAWVNGDGIVAFTGDYGTRLTFGMDDFDRKLRAWNGFYAQIVPKIGLSSITTVDLRYRDQVVTNGNQASDSLKTNNTPPDTRLAKQDS
jgi:cell division septal protein FtsQ